LKEVLSNPTSPSSERSLWQKAVRDVKPLQGRAAAAVGAAPVPQRAPERVEDPQAYRPPLTPALDRYAGIDRANAERLKRGLHKIEARLDLHGMTQVEAHQALTAFIRTSRDAGRRCVLIITGRGLGPNGPGVLKNAVPRWLEEPGLRRQVLATAAAQPRHGGAGAAYILLRRCR
jgi:DNA-nicking Smr family endonuclease